MTHDTQTHALLGNTTETLQKQDSLPSFRSSFSLLRLCNYLIFLFSLFLLSCSSSAPSYRIGIDPSFYPLHLSGKEANLYAFTTELFQEISQRQKISFILMRESSSNLEYNLKRGKFAAIISSMPPYLFLEKTFSFSSPYLLTGPVLIAPASANDIEHLKEFSGKEIGIVTGSTDAALLISPYPHILIRPYSSIPLLLNAVVAAQSDAALVPRLLAEGYVHDLYEGKLKIVSPPLNDEALRLLTLANAQPELLELFDKGLQELKEDGTVAALLKKWDLVFEKP